MLTAKFDQLVKQLRILPGVGQKSAQRMALHLLTKKRPQGMALAQALDEAMRDIVECQRCHSFSDEAVCPLCQDPRRDDGLLCVVETAADVMAIEQTAGYRGRYFVLGGHLSPLDGIGPEEIGIPALIHRLSSGQVKEVILATNATVEGQATAHYLVEATKHLPVQMTRIAQGVPQGGELEYIDSHTLSQAVHNRMRMK